MFCILRQLIHAIKEITHFSYDEQHCLHFDDRSLRYYHTPTLGADLSKGFDTFQQLDDSADDHLDSLLETLTNYESNSGTPLSADIVTWRGMMTKVTIYTASFMSLKTHFHQIMAAPYDNFNGFVIEILAFEHEMTSWMPDSK